MRVHCLAVACALAAAAAACTTLPPIESNVCGNGVVDQAEDCDLYADPALGPNTVCAQPSDTARACRYVCSASQSCPTGWGCGPDGICRYATGSYLEGPGSPMNMQADHMIMGDVDGDGFPDIVGESSSKVSVLFGSSDGSFPSSYQTGIDFPQGAPAFGDLDQDRRTDIVLPLTSGLFVMLGQSDATMDPVAYSPIKIPTPGGGLQVLPLHADKTQLGDNVLVLATYPGNTFCMQFFEQGIDPNECPPGNPCCLPRRALPVPHDVSELAGRVPKANIDGFLSGNPEQELALAFSGEHKVWIYSSRVNALGRLTMDLRQTVDLGLAHQVLFGARFADVDGDGDLDLMVSVGTFGDDHVMVAKNNGTFLSPFDAPVVDDMFDELATGGVVGGGPLPPMGGGQRWPIGVGDVNLDGHVDFVNANGVFLQNSAGSLCQVTQLCQTAWRTTPDPWVEAEIADFNRDGLPDVAAVAELVPGVDFLNGTGTGLFNRFHVDTDNPPFDLRAGDFDGDLVADLALGQHGTVGGNPVDTLSIMYGQRQGAPLEPLSMGRLNLIEYMEPANIVFDGSTVDVTTDLLVQSFQSYDHRDQRSLAIMIGSSQRRMLSPFTLQAPGVGFPDIPVAVQAGAFDPSDTIPDLLAIAPPRVWMVKGAGEAQFNADDAHAVEVPMLGDGTFSPYCAQWVAGDVDLDGHDQIVAIDNDTRCAGFGGSPTPKIMQASLAGGTVASSLTDDASGLVAPSQMRLQDLNGDGFPELIVVYAGEQFSMGVTNGGGPGTVNTPMKAGIAVYWNAAGTLDLAHPSLVPDFTDVFTRSSAVGLNADEDKELELAILTDRGIYISNYDPTSKQFDVPAGGAAIPTIGASIVLAKDVNADGLDDIIFSEGGTNGLHVYLAKPHLDSGGKNVVTP